MYNLCEWDPVLELVISEEEWTRLPREQKMKYREASQVDPAMIASNNHFKREATPTINEEDMPRTPDKPLNAYGGFGQVNLPKRNEL